MKKIRYNLDSPNSITTPCNLEDLQKWFSIEAQAINDQAVRQVVFDVAENLNSFIRWPVKALLLWPGCDRLKKYHQYPKVIRDLAIVTNVRGLDSRMNGPAIAAFRIAGGERPPRFGSNNSWSIHHIYSGKFPFVEKSQTLHAAKDSMHFTQSAGLVAIHPIADQMCDEFPQFAWLLRAMSYQRFGYDPDNVFSNDQHDEYGFTGKSCIVTPQEAINGKKIETG